MGNRTKMDEGDVMAVQQPKKEPQGGASTPPVKPKKPKTTTKTTAGVHKSAIKDIPLKDLYAEIKRRSRTEMPPERAPRWTPAGQRAHKSRGGTK
jgi:hypothetical protein